MERASARDLVVRVEANGHGFIDGCREGSLSEGNIDVVQPIAARRTETTLGSARHERSRVVCA